jgi:phosphoribosylformylglycinamidine synthase
MAALAGTGARVAGVAAAELYSEAPGRVVACVSAHLVAEIGERAAAAGVAVTELGDAGGDRLVVDGVLDLAVADVVAAWRDRLPAAVASGTVSA